MSWPLANMNDTIMIGGRSFFLVPMGSDGATAQISRAQRSELQRFDSPSLESVEEYKFKPLPPSKKRIRLLQLRSGTFYGPEIFCELIEADYDNPFHIPTKPMDDTKRQATTSKTGSHSSTERAGNREGVKLTKEEQEKQRLELLKEECKRVRDNEIKYEALSWCWGSGSGDYSIYIMDKEGNAFKKRVRRDLALALKYLRKPNETRTLWIDAICIDQNNYVERNQQVQMMSRIYTRASEVCIWLGEDTDESKIAIDFIREEITQLKNFDAMSSDKRYSGKWQALMMLMQRDWFSRRWVVQEIALAAKARIYCGPDSIPWKEFAVAVELFVEVETATHRLSEVMQKDEKFRHIPGWFEYVSELGASLLVQATGKVFRAQRTPLDDNHPNLDDANEMAKYIKAVHTIDPIDRRSLLSLEYLVTTMFIFKATEYRDCVYSMLAIARDATPLAESTLGSDNVSILTMSTFDTFLAEKPFTVDYARPYADVCRDFVEFCIQRKKKLDPVQALDILCRPWALEPPVGTSIRLPVKDKDESNQKEKRKRILPKRTEPWRKYKYAIEVSYLGSRKRFEYRKTDEWDPDDRDTEGYREWILKNEDGERQSGTEVWKRGDGWDLILDLVNYHKEQMETNGKGNETANKGVQGQCRTAKGGKDQETGKKDTGRQVAGNLDLPSWVARACKAPFSLYEHPGMHILKTGRANADPLVGAPKDGHRNYSAAQTEAIRLFKFKKRPKMGHYSLYVEGVELDEVVEVRDASQGGNIPKSWLDLGGWEEPYSQDPPAAFWRTIVADRGQDDRNPPYYYARACKESVLKGGTASGRVNTTDLINNEQNSIIAEFCRRVHAVIWGRSLFKTRGGKLGLATNVRQKDKICILYGCTVPVILEEHKKQRRDKELEDAEDNFEAFKSCMRKMEKLRERRAKYRSQTEEDRSEGQQQTEEDSREKQQQTVQDGGAGEEATEAGGRPEEEGKRTSAQEKKKKKREVKEATEGINETLRAEEQKRQDIRKNEKEAEKQKEQLGGHGTAEDDKMKETELQKKMKEAKENDPKLYHVFKGEGYVHGFMDGEALRAKFYEDFPNRTFELR